MNSTTGEPSENQYKKPRSQARSKPAFEIWLDEMFVPACPERRQCQHATALAQLRQLKPDAEACAAIMEGLEAWKVKPMAIMPARPGARLRLALEMRGPARAHRSLPQAMDFNDMLMRGASGKWESAK